MPCSQLCPRPRGQGLQALCSGAATHFPAQMCISDLPTRPHLVLCCVFSTRHPRAARLKCGAETPRGTSRGERCAPSRSSGPDPPWCCAPSPSARSPCPGSTVGKSAAPVCVPDSLGCQGRGGPRGGQGRGASGLPGPGPVVTQGHALHNTSQRVPTLENEHCAGLPPLLLCPRVTLPEMPPAHKPLSQALLWAEAGGGPSAIRILVP